MQTGRNFMYVYDILTQVMCYLQMKTILAQQIKNAHAQKVS